MQSPELDATDLRRLPSLIAMCCYLLGIVRPVIDRHTPAAQRRFAMCYRITSLAYATFLAWRSVGAGELRSLLKQRRQCTTMGSQKILLIIDLFLAGHI